MPPAAVFCALLLADVPQHSHPTWRDFTATTWIAVVLAAAATVWVIWKAVVYAVHPGEEEPDHIKRLILSEPEAVAGAEGLQVTLSSVAPDASAPEPAADDVAVGKLSDDIGGGQQDA